MKKTKLKKLWREVKRNKQIYILLLPVVIWYVIFHYGPMYGAVIAFKDFKPALGIVESPWAGFKHFIAFFEDLYFGRVMRNTILISIYQIIFSMPSAIIFALFVNEINNLRYKKMVQTVSYLPHFISMVVMCGMLVDFVGSKGIITQFLSLFGVPEKNLLMVPEYYRTIHVASGVWQTMGWNSIIYLSALTGIEQEQYEAASLDGASRLQKMRYITLPGLIPTTTIMLIMNIGKVMSVGHEKVILLSNSVTWETAEVISSYVYRTSLASTYPRFSYSAAIGLFQSIINMVLVLATNKISRKLNGSGLW